MRAPISPTISRPSALGPDVAQALAPQVEAFAPPGPIFDELPPVDVEPDTGFVEGEQPTMGPGQAVPGGSQLVNAIMAETPPEQPLAAAAGPVPRGPSLKHAAGAGPLPGPIIPQQGFIERYLAAQESGHSQPKTLMPGPPPVPPPPNIPLRRNPLKMRQLEGMG